MTHVIRRVLHFFDFVRFFVRWDLEMCFFAFFIFFPPNFILDDLAESNFKTSDYFINVIRLFLPSFFKLHLHLHLYKLLLIQIQHQMPVIGDALFNIAVILALHHAERCD